MESDWTRVQSDVEVQVCDMAWTLWTVGMAWDGLKRSLCWLRTHKEKRKEHRKDRKKPMERQERRKRSE